MRRIALALLVLPLFADDVADGLKALEAKNYELAVQLFSKAAAADPQDYSVHFNLGLAQSMLNRDDEATAEYRKVLALKPGLYQAELNLGILLLRDKKPNEALIPLQLAVDQKPKEFRPNYYAAEAYLAAGQSDRAQQHYQTALEADPKSAPAELGLGRAFARQGILDNAAPHFRKAAELDGSYKDALLELAGLYETAKNNEAAIEIYRDFPDNAAVRERLGSLRLLSGKAGDAIPDLELAVQKSPTAANLYALASAYLVDKKLDKAEPLLKQACEKEPQNFDLRLNYGRVLRDERKFTEAAREFWAAAQLHPDSLPAWNELSGIFIMQEDYPKALAALDRAKALGNDTAGYYYFRAIVLDKTKQLKPALECYQQFLARSVNQRPDEEFKARQRVKVLTRELSRR